MSQTPTPKLPFFKPLYVQRECSDAGESTLGSVGAITPPLKSKDGDVGGNEDSSVMTEPKGDQPNRDIGSTSLIDRSIGQNSREPSYRSAPIATTETGAQGLSKEKQKLVKKLGGGFDVRPQPDDHDEPSELAEPRPMVKGSSMTVEESNERIAEQHLNPTVKLNNSYNIEPGEVSIGEKRLGDPPTSSIVQNAYDRMRPRRNLPEVASITIGSKTMNSVLGSSSAAVLGKDKASYTLSYPRADSEDVPKPSFSSSMRSFAVPESELIQTIGKPQSISHMSINHLRDDGNSQPSLQDMSSSSLASNDVATGDPNSDDEMRNIGISDEGQHFSSPVSDTDSDEAYVDEVEKKAIEEARVSELIRQAEEASTLTSQDNRKRAYEILKGVGRKDSTTNLIQVIDASLERIKGQLRNLSMAVRRSLETRKQPVSETTSTVVDPLSEERLSLTVSKADFGAMHIVGQFNLGFILATRDNTDLFIIDQHASDEKYNFERLQATTVVQNQRLVQPYTLRLTAVEEEVILEYNEALLKNGFLIDTDTSGNTPVGQRCKLISLPMSREVVFDVTDLEELVALLADSSTSSSMENVPRPSKVRRMFAMRACRSSIMVGKTLALKQMGSLVRKMGEIDKPWSCPHGRPTMRHVCGLEAWECWSENDGLTVLEEGPEAIDWTSWVSGMRDRYDDTDNLGGEDGKQDWGDEKYDE